MWACERPSIPALKILERKYKEKQRTRPLYLLTTEKETRFRLQTFSLKVKELKLTHTNTRSHSPTYVTHQHTHSLTYLLVDGKGQESEDDHIVGIVAVEVGEEREGLLKYNVMREAKGG